MPLKVDVMLCIQDLDAEGKLIGAINTLKIVNGKICGVNTDGFGALNAIEKTIKVKGQRMVIIGAGGASKAIAYEACKRGALVIIFNRHAEKAMQLAKELACQGRGLEEMASLAESGYDILVNTTPVAMPIDSSQILSDALVMDIKTKPRMTPFLEAAITKGCRVVYGYEMFVEQAIGQFDFWFDQALNSHEVRGILETEAKACL